MNSGSYQRIYTSQDNSLIEDSKKTQTSNIPAQKSQIQQVQPTKNNNSINKTSRNQNSGFQYQRKVGKDISNIQNIDFSQFQQKKGNHSRNSSSIQFNRGSFMNSTANPNNTNTTNNNINSNNNNINQNNQNNSNNNTINNQNDIRMDLSRLRRKDISTLNITNQSVNITDQSLLNNKSNLLNNSKNLLGSIPSLNNLSLLNNNSNININSNTINNEQNLNNNNNTNTNNINWKVKANNFMQQQQQQNEEKTQDVSQMTYQTNGSNSTLFRTNQSMSFVQSNKQQQQQQNILSNYNSNNTNNNSSSTQNISKNLFTQQDISINFQSTNKENSPEQSNKPQEVDGIMIDDNLKEIQDYMPSIINHMREREPCLKKLTKYFEDVQTDINEKMRGILLDWLIDVHLKFKLLPETLFMTVHLIDRYLAEADIPRTKLQLVGIASLFIACKYEEVYGVPHIKDLVYVCDKAYTKEEIFAMEGDIILKLQFDLICISPFRFLEYYAKQARMEEKNYMLCRYLIEMTLLELRMYKYKASMIACAAIYLVHKIRKNAKPWYDDIMIKFTKYSENEVRPCAKDLCALLQSIDKKTSYKSLKKKFSQPQFCEVSKIRIERRQQQQQTQQDQQDTNSTNIMPQQQSLLQQQMMQKPLIPNNNSYIPNSQQQNDYNHNNSNNIMFQQDQWKPQFNNFNNSNAMDNKENIVCENNSRMSFNSYTNKLNLQAKHKQSLSICSGNIGTYLKNNNNTNSCTSSNTNNNISNRQNTLTINNNNENSNNSCSKNNCSNSSLSSNLTRLKNLSKLRMSTQGNIGSQY